MAIIGGGAAGLSAALFLHNLRSQDQQTVFRCAVFEAKPRLGGNCETAYLGKQPFSEPFADLGVNDFNSERYKLFMCVLEKLASAGYPIPHQPIIDSTTWSMPSSVPPEKRITYTDWEMKHWQEQTNPEKKKLLEQIATDWQRFQEVAADVMENPRFARMTVDEFTREMAFSREFSEYNLLACINGMYFVNETSPGSMPIRPIMNYYHLQKGIGLEKKANGQLAAMPAENSPRHYFVNGSSDWIRQLSQYLQDGGVEMRVGALPTAHRTPEGKWRVVSQASQPDDSEDFDFLVSAVHAETVPTVIETGLPERLPSLLAEFKHSQSIAMVHDDPSVLPVDPENWSTYNLQIYPNIGSERRPYTITYIEHKHHGEDINSPPFVTLAPSQNIDEERIYDMLSMSGPERAKCIIKFRHNMLTVGANNAQMALGRIQGENNLYLTGGWTIGVGIQEEVLAMSREIALRIRGYFVSGVHDEGYRDDGSSYVPKYIRDTLIEAPELFPAGFWN